MDTWIGGAMNYKLEIPYAYTSDKQLVSPEIASKSIDYFCPECENPVILRKGEVRIAHFAHLPDVETNCTGEGVVHKVAKDFICNYYNRSFRIQKPAVGIKCKCHKCGELRYMRPQPIYSHLYHAKTEVDICEGARRLDIGVFYNLELAFGIEVHNTSRVSEEEWRDYGESRLPVIEVEAQDIIDYQESMWQWLKDNYENRHTARAPGLKLNPIRQNFSDRNMKKFLWATELKQGLFDCPKCNPEEYHNFEN